MKKMLAAVLVLVVALGGAVGAGAGEYDVSAMPTDALYELMDEINAELANRNTDVGKDSELEPITLHSEGGVYVEYRGLKRQRTNEWQFVYYMTNNSNDTLDVIMDNVRVDGCSIQIGNSTSSTLKPGDAYLSTANYDFYFDAKYAKEYGLSRCERIEFDLVVRPWGKELQRYPVELNLGIDVE